MQCAHGTSFCPEAPTLSAEARAYGDAIPLQWCLCIGRWQKSARPPPLYCTCKKRQGVRKGGIQSLSVPLARKTSLMEKNGTTPTTKEGGGEGLATTKSQNQSPHIFFSLEDLSLRESSVNTEQTTGVAVAAVIF